jgi:hypothetical protein
VAAEPWLVDKLSALARAGRDRPAEKAEASDDQKRGSNHPPELSDIAKLVLGIAHRFEELGVAEGAANVDCTQLERM